MKTNSKRHLLTLTLVLSLFVSGASAQSTDDLLNFLIEKNVITLDDAAALRSDAALKEQEKPKDKSFKIEAEFRPRTEYRNGYQQLRTDTQVAAVFTNQRSRILFTYEQKNKLILHTSIQDIRVWGQNDPRSTAGTLQVFETYAEPFITPNFSIRIGRQKLAFDNQRLFAQNDWRANAGSHDALNFRYGSENLTSDLAFAFNQTSERVFGTDFTPTGFTNYKTLGVHYLRYKVTPNWVLSTINAADGYQDAIFKEKIYQRFTDGGRVEYENGGIYATFSGYYQSGKNATGKTIKAWYIQPEIRYTIPKSLVVRLGAEVFSGQDATKKSTIDNSFVALYGVAHRFNGSMDFFTRFPNDFNNAGLVNPYLFIIKNIGSKFELRSDFHTFYSENNFVVTDKKTKKTRTIDKYLGFENDWLLTYNPNDFTKLDVGFSYALPTDAMAVIKKVGNPKLTPTWAYVQITFKPQLFKTKF